ncbi:MAG: NAD-dependent epimerase/dehydratase family protein [Lachnospiraceae bacterium]|nr:NAD-dependent epimerase/dehydratase family protein [Lachnospiraceae bacterium]
MKVLVTGANGYIGQGVVRALLSKGCEVIATDFNLENVDEKAVKMPGNIFEIEDPFSYFEKPDVVLHLAWRDGFKHASLNHINDLPNHYAFLRSLIEGGLKHLTVLGSMHEVGFFEGSINENTPTNPQSNYGIAKNALRQSLELLKKDYDFVFQWVRGFYIVGNTEYGCSIFSKITEASKKGQETFPFTTGENQYDFIDYDVFCNQVASVAVQDKVNGIINCCSGRPMRLSERVENFISENGYDIKLEYGAFPDRPYDSKAIWGDDSKIKEIMNSK